MHTLKNGLKVMYKYQEGVSTTVQISFKVGSINEEDGQRGYSHLVEHLVFEGTEKRPDAQIITSEIENLGGDFNAATSNETTTFYVKLLSKHLPKALEILSDIVRNSIFSEDKVKKEKKVVLEEIKMIDDNPRYYQWVFLEKHLFSGTPYSFPVYGLVEDVTNSTPEKLKAYFKKYYVPSNATLTIVSSFSDELEVIKNVEEFFGGWAGKEVDEIICENPSNKEGEFTEFKSMQQEYVIRSCITPCIKDADAPVIELIEAILGKPQSGLLVNEIRNKRGLAYDVSVSYEEFFNFGFFAINVGIDPKNESETVKAIDESIKMLQTISEEDLQNAKNHIEGRTLLELEDNHRTAELLNFWAQVVGKDLSKEYITKLMAVTLDDVKRVARTYLEKKQTIVYLKPQIKT